MGCVLSNAHPKSFLVHTISGYAQGTTYSIKYYGDQVVAKKEVDSVLNVIDLSMSIYSKNSLISTFNNPQTKRIVMDDHLQKVIQASVQTYTATQGYFDITVMPLVNLWGFGPQGWKHNPSAEEVQQAKDLVGMQYLKVKDRKLIKRKNGIAIDVNGIAQGYSVDVLSGFLRDKNITNFLVEIGGEIYASGQKPTGEFVVEVQRPYESVGLRSFAIKLKNCAITTSGTYEKQMTSNGESYSHHIDPNTGYPLKSKTLSVTVIAKDAMTADAIDNYLLSLAPEAAIKYVENQANMEAYLVYKENNIFKELQSSGFNNYIYK